MYTFCRFTYASITLTLALAIMLHSHSFKTSARIILYHFIIGLEMISFLSFGVIMWIKREMSVMYALITKATCFTCIASWQEKVEHLKNHYHEQEWFPSLKSQCSFSYLPSREDAQIVKNNLVTLVSQILTQYIQGMSCLSKFVPQHIMHKYSKEMSRKSEVIVLDILMKNENCHSDMVEIMTTMQGYLGNDYPSDRRVASGGDHLTCERQLGAQRHMMDGDTPKDRLVLLEPQAEDWHCLVCVLGVSTCCCTCRYMHI